MADLKSPIERPSTSVSSVVTKTPKTPGSEDYIQNVYSMGVNFDNVIGVDEKGEKFTLKYFFQHYIHFLKNNFFIYRGRKKPVNKQTAIWIKTTQLDSDEKYQKKPTERTFKSKNYATVIFDD